MASIISQTFVDGDSKGLALSNEEWGRTLAIGGDWTRLRIGVMLNLTPVDTANITTASLRLGMSSAANMHAGSGSAGFWAGLTFGAAGLAGGTLTYNAGGGNPYYTYASHAAVRILAGVVSGGTSGSTCYIATDGGAARLSCLFVELAKSGTNLTVAGRTQASAPVQVTLAQFRAAMESSFVFHGNTSQFDSTNVDTSRGDEDTFANYPDAAAAHGELVAVHIGWNKSATPLNIHALEVYRHA